MLWFSRRGKGKRDQTDRELLLMVKRDAALTRSHVGGLSSQVGNIDTRTSQIETMVREALRPYHRLGCPAADRAE